MPKGASSASEVLMLSRFFSAFDFFQRNSAPRMPEGASIEGTAGAREDLSLIPGFGFLPQSMVTRAERIFQAKFSIFQFSTYKMWFRPPSNTHTSYLLFFLHGNIFGFFLNLHKNIKIVTKQILL